MVNTSFIVVFLCKELLFGKWIWDILESQIFTQYLLTRVTFTIFKFKQDRLNTYFVDCASSFGIGFLNVGPTNLFLPPFMVYISVSSNTQWIALSFKISAHWTCTCYLCSVHFSSAANMYVFMSPVSRIVRHLRNHLSVLHV